MLEQLAGVRASKVLLNLLLAQFKWVFWRNSAGRNSLAYYSEATGRFNFADTLIASQGLESLL